MSKTKGFTKCDNKVLLDNTLSPISKLVYVGLGYYDRGRGCFCKRQTLARMLNVSLYQLRNALTELVSAQLIVIHRRGYGKTSIIRVVANTETHEVPKTSSHTNRKDEEEVLEVELASQTAKDDVENQQNREHTPQNDAQTTQTLHPNPEHLLATTRLHKSIEQAIRPTAYNTWFPNKTAVSYEDDTSIKITCIDSFTANWLKSHFTDTIKSITGKQVVFHAKENEDGKGKEEVGKEEAYPSGGSSLPKVSK